MATENQALNAALGTDMTPAPFKEPDYSKIRTLPQVFAEEKRVGDLQAQAAGELKKAELTQQANIAGEQAKAATEIANRAKTYVEDAQKKEAEFPYPEFHPTKDNAESLAGIFSIVSTLGIMLGSSGKQSGLNAMNAMTGMMNGWQKGRADLFKREKEEFDKEFNRIKVLRESLRKDLEDYMKLLPYDKEAAMYKAAEISAKAGSDSIINAYVKKGQAENALKLLDSAGKMIQHQEDKNLQIQLAREKEKLRVKGDLPSYIMETTGARLSEKDAAEVATAANAIGHAYALKEMVAQHPEWVGRKGQIGQFFNRYVDSLQSGKPLPADDANLAKDKSGQDALVFAKDYAAYLVNYERAVAGGAKGFTVSFQNRFNKLLDQNQFNPKGFENLMDQHIDEITRIAATKSPAKINKQNLTAVGMDINKDDPYAVAGFNRFGGVKAPDGAGGRDVETQAKKSFGSYEPDKYDYGYENGKFYRDKK